MKCCIQCRLTIQSTGPKLAGWGSFLTILASKFVPFIRGVIRNENLCMKQYFKQGCSLVFIGIALLLTIPAVPSVNEGHGYDSFPNPSLFLGLLFVFLSALVNIKYLNHSKFFWWLFALFYVAFSYAVHFRVWYV